jgi:hypothetical protein
MMGYRKRKNLQHRGKAVWKPCVRGQDPGKQVVRELGLARSATSRRSRRSSRVLEQNEKRRGLLGRQFHALGLLWEMHEDVRGKGNGGASAIAERCCNRDNLLVMRDAGQ